MTKKLNLDELRPEDVEITYGGHIYLLEPLSTERLVEIAPIWEKYKGVKDIDLGQQLEFAIEFLGDVLPEFPLEGLKKMTPKQLKMFMQEVAETLGAEVEESPKAVEEEAVES